MSVVRGSEGEVLVGGRYQLGQHLGRGGMAVVHEALDVATGQRLAIKRLRPRRRKNAGSANERELFEREYHVLTELAHPRIVAALDYGVEGEEPYYTMELLDGGDLLARSPLPWRAACSVARDLCSALSLVHSRRMVYRDLSPRNVRCTSDGKAKLIDFGAMAPMGPSPLAVCTPAVAAPEVVYRQALDGRSDLYALGATLYYTLVGRNAYPARNFQDLSELWQKPPRAPSELVPGIPPALDALVLDLLQLDPQLRPASAAEVVQRMSAIASLQPDEQLSISQAYLTTPSLIGRDSEVRLVERMLRRLLARSKGSALQIGGPPGVGRSRLLDTCVLRAKLAGLNVVRTSPVEAPSGAYAAPRAIVDQLLDNLPDETLTAALPHRSGLGMLPALLARLPALPDGTPPPSATHASLRDFLVELASNKPLAIAIDDIEGFDTDSRSLIALLAHTARQDRVLLLLASDGDTQDDSDAAKTLADACSQLTLSALSAEQTQALLESTFGEVPNLELLVRRLHALAGGNPQDLMRLSQHLVDRGVIRFENGSWVLPDRLDAADLPATIAQTYKATVEALDPAARALAQAFALCPDQRFSMEECIALAEQGEHAQVFRAIDRLLAASIIRAAGELYALADRVWVPPLSESISPELHGRLSEVFERRGDGLRAGRHLLRMGREVEALDLLVPHAAESQERTSASSEAYIEFLCALPNDWREIYETALTLCDKHERSARDRFVLRNRLCTIFSQTTACSDGHQAALAAQPARDAGLDIHKELDEGMPAEQRLKLALGGAAKRHAAASEADRLFDPKTAIGQLVRTVITAIGNFTRTLEVEEWRQMPSLSPLAPLSPAVAVTDRLARGVEARFSGRFEDAYAIYMETLAGLEDARDAGLDETFVTAMRAGLVSMLGTLEAVLGRPNSEQWAREVAEQPLYHGSALTIRILDRLWQGDALEANRLMRERELWRLEQPRQQTGDVLSVLWTLQAHAASDDLTHTRHSFEAVVHLAKQMHTWKPIESWARGEYERVRGDLGAALDALDRALEAMTPGQHQIWPLAAAARLKVLCTQERFEEAYADGARDLEAGQQACLGYMLSYIRMPLSLAVAKRGDAEQAKALALASIESFQDLGTRGLNLGLAYEAAAQVAACLGDGDGFERYAKLCKETFLAHDNPALAAKYERLVRGARRAEVEMSESLQEDAAHSTLARSHMETVLLGCGDAQERRETSLRLLVEGVGAHGGYLYGVVNGEPQLVATTLLEEPPPDIDMVAMRYLASELSDVGMTTAADVTEASFAGQWTTRVGQCYRPVLLSHQAPDGFAISGLAVLAFDCTQTLKPASEAATHLSRFLCDRGDLKPNLVA